MTIATTATTDLTVDGLITFAMRSVGVLNNDHPAKPADLAHGRTALFVHLAALQSRGIILRARERTTLAVTAGVDYVDAPADTLSIEAGAILRDSAGTTDRILDLIQVAQYQELPNKATTGTPVFYYPEKRPASETWRVFLYPVPLDASEPTIILPPHPALP